MISRRWMRKKIREYYKETGKQFVFIDELMEYMFPDGWTVKERNKVSQFLRVEGVEIRKVRVRGNGKWYYTKNLYNISML